MFENHRKSRIQNCHKRSNLASFRKPEAYGQTMFPDRSIWKGQKLVENAKMPKFKCDFLGDFQTLWTKIRRFKIVCKVTLLNYKSWLERNFLKKSASEKVSVIPVVIAVVFPFAVVFWAMVVVQGSSSFRTIVNRVSEGRSCSACRSYEICDSRVMWSTVASNPN